MKRATRGSPPVIALIRASSLLPLGIADFVADFILDLSGDVSRPSENFAAFGTPPMPAAVQEPAPAGGEQQIAFAPRMEALRVVDVPGPQLCELFGQRIALSNSLRVSAVEVAVRIEGARTPLARGDSAFDRGAHFALGQPSRLPGVRELSAGAFSSNTPALTNRPMRNPASFSPSLRGPSGADRTPALSDSSAAEPYPEGTFSRPLDLLVGMIDRDVGLLRGFDAAATSHRGALAISTSSRL